MTRSGEATQVFNVDANRRWNDTNLVVKKGRRYSIDVPAGQEWTDWFVRCGPEGYERWWLSPLATFRRLPTARFFALVGSVDRRQMVEIKPNMLFQPEIDGLLSFFANDIGLMYWNNKGSIEVRVTPLDEST